MTVKGDYERSSLGPATLSSKNKTKTKKKSQTATGTETREEDDRFVEDTYLFT